VAGRRDEGAVVTTATYENPLRRPANHVLPLTILLEQGDTDLPGCHTLPATEYGTGFYHAPQHPLSVAVLPQDGRAYEYGCSVVARQNARYAAKQGYRWEIIDRADWEDDLHALRSSTSFRQGRDMPAAYMEWQPYSSDAWPEPHCKRHLATVHGVIGPDGHLAGYMQVVQCGEVVRVNTILGHADKLADRVMWLLLVEAIKWHIDECGAGFFLYYTHASGHGPGLRYFKERLGFRPHQVEWVSC
jgi:hypothetical protein